MTGAACKLQQRVALAKVSAMSAVRWLSVDGLGVPTDVVRVSVETRLPCILLSHEFANIYFAAVIPQAP